MLGKRLMTVGLLAPVLALALLTLGWTPRPAVDRVPEAQAYEGWTPASGSSAENSVDPAWTLVIDGLVQTPLNLTLDDILAMPSHTVFARLFCVSFPSIPAEQGNWTGVTLEFLLEEAGVSPDAVKVAFYASDGFSTDLTVTTAMRGDIILAYEKDGQPLEEVRLVVPGKFGYKWIMSLIHIELVDYDFLGTYERSGYTDEADIPGYSVPVGGFAELPDGLQARQTAATPSPGTLPIWAAVGGVVAGAAALGGGLSLARKWLLR